MVRVARCADDKLVATAALHAGVVVLSRPRSPSDAAVESSGRTTIVVRRNDGQVAIQILSEDGNVRATCVVRCAIVDWRVTRAQGDLLVRIRVDDIPHTRIAEDIIAKLKTFQAFVVVGVCQGARSAQVASQSLRIRNVVVGRGELTRAVVRGSRWVEVVRRSVRATFD